MELYPELCCYTELTVSVGSDNETQLVKVALGTIAKVDHCPPRENFYYIVITPYNIVLCGEVAEAEHDKS